MNTGIARASSVVFLSLSTLFSIGCGSSSSAKPGAGGGGGQEAGAADGGTPGAGGSSSDSGKGGAATDGPVFQHFTTDYSDSKLWLCGSSADHDYCLDAQTAKAVNPDGSQTDVSMTAAATTKLDCFYVYPTVAIVDPEGNRATFDNVPDILDPLMGQAAPFNQVCTVYAPLYHQATLSTYQGAHSAEYLDIAYEDVKKAFHYYVDHLSQGRKFVLMGHSQGTHMIRRIIQREVETDPALLSRLVLALGVGPVGDLNVPKGKDVGGTFAKVPICRAADQTGCIITFDTFANGYPPQAPNPDPATVIPCTNPGALGGGPALLVGALFPTSLHQTLLDPKVTTGVTNATFAVYQNFFTGECKETADGKGYLEISATGEQDAGETRANPVPFDAALLNPGAPYFLGMHLLDYTFPMGELLDAVRTRAAKL